MTQYMRLFRACSTSRTLTEIHGHLMVTGLYRDPLASTKLIEFYAKMGPMKSSRAVFNQFPIPDSFMWGVVIKCHVWNGLFEDSICLYNEMLREQREISRFVFPSVLSACSGIGDLGFGKRVHGTIIKCLLENDCVIETALLKMYGEMGCVGSAREVFDKMPVRDVVSWSSIISCYVRNGVPRQGLEIVSEMMVEESLNMDEVTMLSVAEACGEMGLWREAKSLHCFALRSNVGVCGNLGTSILAMYAKCGDLRSSEALFDKAVDKSTSFWTAMISCYHQNGLYQEALGLFVEMLLSGVKPTEVTLMRVVLLCARLSWLNEGKTVHGYAVRNAIGHENDLLGPALVDLYASCGRLRECCKVFNSTRNRQVLLWNMLISIYFREGMIKEGLEVFKKMLSEQILPDSFTLASVLSACGDIGFSQLGFQIHNHALKLGIQTEFVQNSLIAMYCKSGLLDSANAVFWDTEVKGVVTWNAIISGFSQNGNPKEAMALFNEMHSNSMEMNDVTFLSAIQACSNLGCIEDGKWIHHKVIIHGMRHELYIDTALVNMYAKCGGLPMARRVFDNMVEKNIVSWSTLIGAYAIHGQADSAISVFTEMIESGGPGIRPNEITFMNILSACRHAGYLAEGKMFFNSMMNDFAIKPNFEHYAILVDLLSRAGDLDGAYEVIKSMPTPVDASVWGALVNGCRIHHRMDVIRRVKENLRNVETDDTGYYILLSNLYAEGGEWDEFNMVRANMARKGLQKVQGCSMIKIDKMVHQFGANNKSPNQIEDIFSLIDNIYAGYTGDIDVSVV